MKPVTYKFLLFAYACTVVTWFLLVYDFTALRKATPEWWEIVDFVTFSALGVFTLVASIKFTVEKIEDKRIERKNHS